MGNRLATIAIDRIRDTEMTNVKWLWALCFERMFHNFLEYLPVIVKCQLDCTMLPIHEMLILSICDSRMHRWYEAIHQAILKILLQRLSNCGFVILSSPDRMIEIWSIFCGAASRKHSNILTKATSLSSFTSFPNHLRCSTLLFCSSACLHFMVYTRVFQYLMNKWVFSSVFYSIRQFAIAKLKLT